ncbi:hypothetical protein [uncultured Winogradskyella sp.]|uniref:hypothetical protein n=1 Tax=uncultured Winogradskyella sp. TaxID=395353 RepID=UPI0030EF405A|tara:strand:+ start:402 stop:869 length:468 start_codon:yes stop_codon:yes gene_type:complete
MKKTILLLFTVLFALNVQAQRRNNSNRIPQTSSEPTEEQLAKRQREMEERKEEYIDNFLTTLEADEFQKHIIKQNINSFFDAKIALFKMQFEHRIDRQTAIENLENTHFKDLEELISESDMVKIKEMIKGEFDEKEVLKDKKEKRKKRKRKKDKD